MKLSPDHIEKLTDGQLSSTLIALVHGSDVGLVAETAKGVLDRLGVSKQDPFHYNELEEDTFKSRPASLMEELETLSFDGGKRLVLLRASQERTATLINTQLDKLETSDNPPVLLLIKSVPLKANNPLRKTAEKAKNMIAFSCEPDNAASLKSVIQQTLHQEGLTIQSDALSTLLEEFGDDRAYTRNELEKLILFKSGDKSPITLEEVSELTAAQNNATLFEIAKAVTGKKPQQVEKLLNKAFVQGESPVGIVRTVLRFVERTKPPVSGAIFSALYEAERQLKSTSYPDVAICRQTLIRIAKR